MTPLICWYEAHTKLGIWDGKSLDVLINKIVDYYADGDSYLPEITHLVRYVNDEEHYLSAARVDQFNEELRQAFDESIINLHFENLHVREISSPYLTGRL